MPVSVCICKVGLNSHFYGSEVNNKMEFRDFQKSNSVNIQIKATEQYVPLILLLHFRRVLTVLIFRTWLDKKKRVRAQGLM